MRVLFVELRKA